MRMYSPLVLVVAALSGAAVIAQGEVRPAPAPAPTTTPSAAADYAFLDDILGANVWIEPGAEKRREAADDNEKAKRASGEVKDLILDSRTGAIECAVVSFGGVLGLGDKTVALPATLLTWNATDKRFLVRANEDQLKTLPAFDLKEARKRGLDNEINVLRTSWSTLESRPAGTPPAGQPDSATRKDRSDESAQPPKDKPAHDEHAKTATDKTGTVAGTTFVVVPHRYMAGSEVDDYPVYALSEKFGKIDKCIIDRNARKLEFCVVSHGGALGVGDTKYLLPHRIMTLCRDGDDQIYCVNQSTDQLKNGVRYEKPKHGGVVDPEAVKRVGTMY